MENKISFITQKKRNLVLGNLLLHPRKNKFLQWPCQVTDSAYAMQNKANQQLFDITDKSLMKKKKEQKKGMIVCYEYG